ncbi:MAG: hypothetical protein ABIS20_01840 [Thermoanaerobaculia bacterium]
MATLAFVDDWANARLVSRVRDRFSRRRRAEEPVVAGPAPVTD